MKIAKIVTISLVLINVCIAAYAYSAPRETKLKDKISIKECVCRNEPYPWCCYH